jgi:hypothetical protein
MLERGGSMRIRLGLTLGLVAAALSGAACGPVTRVSTRNNRADIIEAVSNNDMTYIVDKRTHLCFFLYTASEDVPTTSAAPIAVAPVACEALRALPGMADRLDFLPPAPSAATAETQ